MKKGSMKQLFNYVVANDELTNDLFFRNGDEGKAMKKAFEVIVSKMEEVADELEVFK